MKSENIRKLTGTALFTALVVVLQLLSNYISFGPVNITLSLTPIVLGALLYGPIVGAFLGLVNGAIVLTAPATLSVFMTANPVATVFICLLKTAIAGAIAGFMPMIFRNEKIRLIGVILASLLVPIINTGLFAIGSLIFFMDIFQSVEYLFLTAIGVNFLIEFGVNALLSPTIYFLYDFYKKRYQHE